MDIIKLLKIAKYLPGGSLAYYLAQGADKDKEKGKGKPLIIMRKVFHMEYFLSGILLSMLAAFYPLDCMITGEYNPLKQRKIIEKMTTVSGREYDKLYNLVFCPEGLSDLDSNGVISDSERIKAYQKMGRVVFPEPSLYELEKLVEIYNSKDSD